MQHFFEKSDEWLELFLKEELIHSLLAQWQNHYLRCEACRNYIGNHPLNQAFLQEAQQMEALFSSEQLDSLTFALPRATFVAPSLSKPPVSLKLFLAHTLFAEEILYARAAGVSEQTFPNFSLPEAFTKENDVSLVFEEDPFDHSLNIGLQGCSAKGRLATSLKVNYQDETCELFEGKEIALGSMWSLEASKVDSILGFELLIYGTQPEETSLIPA